MLLQLLIVVIVIVHCWYWCSCCLLFLLFGVVFAIVLLLKTHICAVTLCSSINYVAQTPCFCGSEVVNVHTC